MGTEVSIDKNMVAMVLKLLDYEVLKIKVNSLASKRQLKHNNIV